MSIQPAPEVKREPLAEAFEEVRQYSEIICAPLCVDDYQIQSIAETSPPKWHLAHTTWFFEAFVLAHFQPTHRPYQKDFAYLFNSYYETVGSMHPRAKRGLLSRPTVEEVYAYRAAVNEQVVKLMAGFSGARWDELAFRVTLGLNHEQQHQELMFMDVKHNLFANPLKPAYRNNLPVPEGETRPMGWVDRPGGILEVGHRAGGFAYDNESPRHRVLLDDHRLADRFVTNGEFSEFIEDGGYSNPALWLADGWYLIGRKGWRHPLYWCERDGEWTQFTLGGERPLNPHEPVCHLSFYEADAYARWAGKRLALEKELESLFAERPIIGNFADRDCLHPEPAGTDGQWFGDLWAWTASPYGAYPGFRPLEGSMGEYNGKFMANQMVLRGGCCVTPAGHIRPTYRNFFYLHDRWAFTGLRLAEDL